MIKLLRAGYDVTPSHVFPVQFITRAQIGLATDKNARLSTRNKGYTVFLQLFIYLYFLVMCNPNIYRETLRNTKTTTDSKVRLTH